jgi:hypothetical protein
MRLGGKLVRENAEIFYQVVETHYVIYLRSLKNKADLEASGCQLKLCAIHKEVLLGIVKLFVQGMPSAREDVP